jgi:16S rRNA (uracil1498-N3)-methyltransferase
MPHRLYVDGRLEDGMRLALPAGSARHVQVLRLQPGSALIVFNGDGRECDAVVTRIGRSEVEVQVDGCRAVDRELPLSVVLAVGMPANDRMDALVEKATELGVAAIQPLLCERSVLRLAGERAERKCEHWRGVAVAAAEQCGRTRLPRIEAVRSVRDWLAGLPRDAAGQARLLLSVHEAPDLRSLLEGRLPAEATLVSGPEGGLTTTEEDALQLVGFERVSLGPRVLRADTAPLAALAQLALLASRP